MLTKTYAVVKNGFFNLGEVLPPYQFFATYDNYNIAKVEAERLCLKERCEFWIIKVIAKCNIAEVKWEVSNA